MVVAMSRWETVAALADPVRRALFDHVRRQDHPVTREEAGDAVAISRTLTAFHLDKLVDAGLLRARYESPPDRQRGRGRTPKVYEPTGEGLNLTVPARQYELIGEILADAVATDPTDARTAAVDRATAMGRHVGVERAGRTTVLATLADHGFEPRVDGADIVLDNCPFHPLAGRHPDLICAINLAFLTGLLDGLGESVRHAQLRPGETACCVRLSA